MFRNPGTHDGRQPSATMRYRRALEGPGGTARILARVRRTVDGPITRRLLFLESQVHAQRAADARARHGRLGVAVHVARRVRDSVKTMPTPAPTRSSRTSSRARSRKVIQRARRSASSSRPSRTTATEPAYTVTVANVLTQVSPGHRRGRRRRAASPGSRRSIPKPAPDNSWIGLVLTGLLPLIIIGGFIYFMMRQAQGTNNQALQLRQEPRPDVPRQQAGRDLRRRRRAWTRPRPSSRKSSSS